MQRPMGSYSFEIFHLALARLSKFNHHLIPVDKPRCPVMNCHRDGFMRVDENGGGSVNYEPNSFNGPVQLTPLIKRRGASQEMPLDIITATAMMRTIYFDCGRRFG
jgi:catalase